MENEQISDICTDTCGEQPKISRLAVASVVFGVWGPFSARAMWVVSPHYSFTLGSRIVMVVFSYGLAWILGLVFGQKSFVWIRANEGRLAGREYAIAGIVISTAWMLLTFAIFLLPGLCYVNS